MDLTQPQRLDPIRSRWWLTWTYVWTINANGSSQPQRLDPTRSRWWLTWTYVWTIDGGYCGSFLFSLSFASFWSSGPSRLLNFSSSAETTTVLFISWRTWMERDRRVSTREFTGITSTRQVVWIPSISCGEICQILVLCGSAFLSGKIARWNCLFSLAYLN